MRYRRGFAVTEAYHSIVVVRRQLYCSQSPSSCTGWVEAALCSGWILENSHYISNSFYLKHTLMTLGKFNESVLAT